MCIHVKFDIHLAVVASDMAGILQALHTFALLQEAPAMQSLESALNAKAAIGLDAMDSVALMDRFDEKFLIPSHWLDDVVRRLTSFSLLRIQGESTTTYNNRYFDSPTNQCFEDHVRGKSKRFKVRIRHYANTNVAFLEVKVRDVHGKTVKHRIVRDAQQGWNADLTETEWRFIREHVGHAVELQPVLESRFERFTLADLASGERITVDSQLQFRSLGDPVEWLQPVPALSIVERKQEHINHQGPLLQAFRSQKQRRAPLGRSLRMSKFILGRMTLTPNLNPRTYRMALRDIERAERFASNPLLIHNRILK